MTDRQQAEVETLLEIRRSAVADLTARTTPHPDPQWTADRIADVERANRTLERLGVIPAL